MAFTDILSNIKNSLLSKFIVAFNGGNDPNVNEEKLPIFPEWFFTARLGQPRQINIQEIRQFARSPWVQMVLATMKKEVKTIPWDIVAKDEEDETDYSEYINKIKELFTRVNSNRETLVDLLSPIITDIGEIDAGTWVKVYSIASYEIKMVPTMDDLGTITGEEERPVLKPFGQRELLEIVSGDASTFLKQIDRYKRLMAYYQYSFKNPRSNPRWFQPEEVTYFQMNDRSYSAYGYSPVQSIQQVLEVLIQSTRWNKEYFKNNGIPDGIVGLPGANPESMKAFKNSWKEAIQGKAHKLIFHNTAANFESFMKSGRDMEWLEGQKWYFHLVFGAFGVSPTEAGFYENSNRSTQEGQERITVKNAIKPYLQMFEDKINNDIIPEILQQENPGICFKFFPTDHAQEQIEFDHSMKEIQTGTMTINEYRKMQGREPVEWGDTPSMQPDDQFGEPPPGMEGSEDNESKSKKEKEEKILKTVVEAGDDVVEESVDYATFYKKVNKNWERKVLKSLDKVDMREAIFDTTLKTFGEFVREVMNEVNTLPFVNKIKKYIIDGLKLGMKSAESETGIQIGFSEAFSDKVVSLENQQLNGYMINGKKWHGIRGATKQLQVDILKTVEECVQNKCGKKKTREKIQEIFEGSSKSQAERIARTETTRFINEGKLTAYKDAKIDGKKAYVAVMDDNTSEICRRLNNKYSDEGVGFDEPFIDPVTSKAYDYPPSHPNCFLKGTKIKVNNGYKKIEDIKIGDKVITHANRLRKVNATMVNEVDEFFELEVGTGKNKRILNVTGNHPILTDRGWVAVNDLMMSDKVLFNG